MLSFYFKIMALDLLFREWKLLVTTWSSIFELNIKWAWEERQEVGIYRFGGGMCHPNQVIEERALCGGTVCSPKGDFDHIIKDWLIGHCG